MVYPTVVFLDSIFSSIAFVFCFIGGLVRSWTGVAWLTRYTRQALDTGRNTTVHISKYIDPQVRILLSRVQKYLKEAQQLDIQKMTKELVIHVRYSHRETNHSKQQRERAEDKTGVGWTSMETTSFIYYAIVGDMFFGDEKFKSDWETKEQKKK